MARRRRGGRRFQVPASSLTRPVAWQATLMEFRAHAFRDPEVNARYGELHHRTVRSIAGFIAELFERRNEPLAVPAEQMAVIALANGTGLVAEYMAAPDIDIDVLIDLSVNDPAAQSAGAESRGASR